MRIEVYEDLDIFLQAFPDATYALASDDVFGNALCFVMDSCFLWMNAETHKFILLERTPRLS